MGRRGELSVWVLSATVGGGAVLLGLEHLVADLRPYRASSLLLLAALAPIGALIAAVLLVGAANVLLSVVVRARWGARRPSTGEEPREPLARHTHPQGPLGMPPLVQPGPARQVVGLSGMPPLPSYGAPAGPARPATTA